MTEAKKMTFGEARSDAKLTMEALAEKAGISYSAVQAIESGRLNPSLLTKLKLADALRRSLKELWPETIEELAELEELQKNDRKRNKMITTSDLDNKGEPTPEYRKRQLREKLL